MIKGIYPTDNTIIVDFGVIALDIRVEGEYLKEIDFVNINDPLDCNPYVDTDELSNCNPIIDTDELSSCRYDMDVKDGSNLSSIVSDINAYELRCCSYLKDKAVIEVIAQLDEYFEGKRKVFELKLDPDGTEFQRRIWEIIFQELPYAETMSYSEVAAIYGNKKAQRAVGMAMNRNPIPIIIPCHRVVDKNSSLTGYAGGLEIKRLLLELESGTKIEG